MSLPTEEEVYAYMKQNEGREFHPEVLAARFKMSAPSMIGRLNSLIKKNLVTARYLSRYVRLFQAPEANPRPPVPARETREWRPLNSAYLTDLRRQRQLCRDRALA